MFGIISACNHKTLGLYYLWFAFIFGLLGSLTSLILRLESLTYIYKYSRIITQVKSTQTDLSYIGHLTSYNSFITLYATNLRYFSIGLLYSIVPIFTLLIFIYTAREVYTSKSSMISTVLTLVILSEILLFAGFFWGAFHYITSISLCTKDSIIFPSSRIIILIITLILASASILTGYGHIIREKAVIGLYANIIVLVFFIGLLFIFLQLSEYVSLDGYINDTITYSIIYCITGLHFFHVLVGIILLLINFSMSPYNYFENLQWTYTAYNSIWIITAQLDYFCLLYWHFVELLWLGIQFTFYNY